jgi:hypothetical protein
LNISTVNLVSGLPARTKTDDAKPCEAANEPGQNRLNGIGDISQNFVVEGKTAAN